MEPIMLSLGKVFMLTGTVSLILWILGFHEGRKYERKIYKGRQIK
jgi:hypothetical protein